MSVPSIGCLAAALVLAAPVHALAPAAASGALAGEGFAAGPLRPAHPPEESTGRFAAGGPTVNLGMRCAPPDQERQTGRRLPKVFGWLYRWARGFDIERSTTSVPLVYLRSPLLTGFQEPADCPPSDTLPEAPVASICVAITAGAGTAHLSTWLLSLPQLGARTPSELESMLRDRLGSGEAVMLRGLGGAAVELGPALAGDLRARACDPETD